MQNRYFLVVLFVVLSFGTLFAQSSKQTVSGYVKTTDGKPADNITVLLKNTTCGALTDKNGRYEFNAPVGKYNLVYYSISAHKKELPISIESGKTLVVPTLTIIENASQLEEVVVTGQFSPQSVRNSVFKIKAITEAQIKAKGATDVQSLLNTELGIRMSNDMALGETDFELMGMSGNNVKVLIDGVPMIDRLSTKQSLSQIDISTIERIEIVEGPMSVIYGSDALAGVINIITKQAIYKKEKLALNVRLHEESVGKEYEAFPTDKPMRLDNRSGWGKRDGIHNQHVNANYKFNNGFSVGASFSNMQNGGWQGDSIQRSKKWQPKYQTLVGANAGFCDKNFNIWYRIDYMDEEILSMANINGVTNRTSDKKFNTDRYTHQLQAGWMLSNRFNLSLASSYQNYSRQTETVVTDMNSGKKWYSDEAGSQDVVDFNSFYSRLLGVWKVNHQLSLQPGLEFQSYKGNGDRVDGAHRINSGAVFLSAEYAPVSWLSIRPGVRSSYNSDYQAPGFVPALNLKASLNGDMDVRASYGRGYRAPTLQELYYSFHDSNHDIDGNPDLKAEFSNSFMASYSWRILHDSKIRLTSTLSGFYNDYKNRISMTSRIDNPAFFTYYNIDKYKTTGFTFENALVWKSLSANVNFSYIGRYNQYSEDINYDKSDIFRFSPELTTSLSYNWENVALFSFFYKYTGARYEYRANNDNTLELAGIRSFNWADFTASRKIGKYVDVTAGVRNIFNITTVENSSATGDVHGGGSGVSQIGCGRSFFVEVAFNLN